MAYLRRPFNVTNVEGSMTVDYFSYRSVGHVELREPEELRKLAAWYRDLAARAGNSAIWEARLRTAEDLEDQAHRLELRTSRYSGA